LPLRCEEVAGVEYTDLFSDLHEVERVAP